MNELAPIRRYAPGEEFSLFDVYFTAIHLVASRDYTPEQIEAWAPGNIDRTLWETKIREINPFVATINGEPVGYADVQPTGYIDHFFVSGRHPAPGYWFESYAEATGRGQVGSHSALDVQCQPNRSAVLRKVGIYGKGAPVS